MTDCDVTACCVDLQGDLMLIKNAQNLMKAVIKTVQAAEAACMKVSVGVFQDIPFISPGATHLAFSSISRIKRVMNSGFV